MLPPRQASCPRSAVQLHATAAAVPGAAREAGRTMRYMAGVLTLLWGLLMFAGQASAQDFGLQNPPYPLPNCTSSSIKNVTITPIPGTTVGACNDPDDVVTVDVRVEFEPTASNVYDMLIGYATGGLVYWDDCLADGYTADPGFPNFLDVDGEADCGDARKVQGAYSGVKTVEVFCDSNQDNLIDADANVDFYFGWNQAAGGSGLPDDVNGPKCDGPYAVSIPLGPKISVTKQAVSGTAEFPFEVDNGASVNTTFSPTLSDGESATSGDFLPAVSGGNYLDVTITELVPTGWDVAVSCTDNKNNPIDLTQAANGVVTIPGTSLVNDTVQQVISCTFTNTNTIGTLELSKVVADGGSGLGEDAGAWSLGYDDGAGTSGSVTVNGDDGTANDADGSVNGVVAINLPAGDYTISELLAGLDYIYDAQLVCNGATVDTGIAVSSGTAQIFDGGTVAVTAGQTTSCVITNTLQTATLTVDKSVVNNSAVGTLADAADWRLAFDGPGTNDANGLATTGAVVVPVGAYVLSETPEAVPAGLTYTQTGLSCTAGALAGNTVTLGDGDVAVCTFENTLSTATLTLDKTVVDPNGIDPSVDTDWTLEFTGPSGAAGSGNEGDATITSVTVPQGDYTFAETGDTAAATDNYIQQSLLCNGVDATGGYSITGDTTCVFTNAINVASLTITKVVVDNSTAGLAPGADSWRMGYTGPESNSLLGTGTTPIDVLVQPGDYAITEQLGGNANTYDVAVSCGTAAATQVTDATTTTVSNVTLAAGDDVTCTVTNTLSTAQLTLVKSVDNGAVTTGLATPADWDLTYAGPAGDTVDSGTAVVVPTGTYTFSEAGKVGAPNTANYAFTSLICGADDVTGSLTYDLQADTTCTFLNTINVAQVTLTKAVSDPAGLGIALDAGSWALTVDGGAAGTNGTATVTDVLVSAGSIALTESAGAHDLNYASSLACNGATGATVDNADADGTGSVTVAAGDNVSCTFTNVLEAGSLRVVKSVPANDFGVVAADWDMAFDGVATANTFAASTAGDTGAIDVPAGDYTISETLTGTTDAHATYVLTSLVCTAATTGDVLNLTGSVAAPIDPAAIPDITVGAGEDVVCTFTNDTNAARLTLIKTVDTDSVAAGTTVPAAGDWTISAAGTIVSGATGTTDVTDVLITAGTYDLQEQIAGGVLNYDAVVSCTDATGFTNDDAQVVGGALTTVGDVTLSAGEDATCTIANTVETATLTLVKSVDANALGVVAEGWDLSFAGPGGASGTGENTEAAITNVVVPAGTYDLSEALNALGTGANADNFALYGLETLVCNGADVTATQEVTLADGDATTCTFTNAATQGRLTLVKTVDDDSVAAGTTVPGAAAWTLSAAGTTPLSGVTGSTDVTSVAVTAGSYTLSEQIAGGVLNYDAAVSCTGAAGGFTDAAAQVVGATSTTVGTVEVGVGEDVVCTIDNTVETATLTLVKSVDANALGVVAEGWDLSFAGPGGASGTGENTEAAITAVTVPAGNYTLDEALNTLGQAGENYPLYSLDGIACSGGADTDGQAGGLDLADGEAVTCTFTNVTTQGRLTLVKAVAGTLDTGTIPAASAWDLTFDGQATGTGSNGEAPITNVAVPAGDYTLSEVIVGGELTYAAALSCSGATGFADAGATVVAATSATVGTVEVGAGETVTCTVTNTVQSAELTLEKVVAANDLGVTNADWDLTFAGPGGAAGTGPDGDAAVTTVTVPLGTYSLSEALAATASADASLYALDTLVCNGADVTATGSYDVAGDTTCVFTNATDQARLTLVKAPIVGSIDTGTVPSENAWTLSASGPSAISGTNLDGNVTSQVITAGSYTVSEMIAGGVLDYGASLSCDNAAASSGTGTVEDAGSYAVPGVVIAAGEDVTCTFTNTLETATLTLVKDVPANALGVTADGWDLTFAGPAGATGTGITGAGVVTTVEVPAGDYSLSEALTAATASDINYQQYGLESLICEVNGQASADLKGAAAPQLTLDDGNTAICTFTNTPNTARVTLVKTLDVPAAYAGLATPAGDWVLSVGTNSFASSAWPSQNVFLTPGSYDLSEANDGEAFLYDAGITCDGGSVTDAGDGTGSLTLVAGDVGSDITCTFANRLETATLTLIKEVDNGSVTTGISGADEWDLTYAGPEAVTATDVTGGALVTSVVVPAGDYTLSELGTGANTGNYVQESLVCAGGADANGADGLTIADGETVSCTFLNTINVGQLTLIKDVTNDNGGDAVPGDFTLSAGGTAFVQNTATVVAAGDYALTESSVTGYAPAATPISCQLSGNASFAGSTVTIGAGDAAVCTFFNDDIAPTYDMVKSASTAAVTVGNTITYSFTFTNNGPWAISDLTPIDTSLTGLSPIDCGAGATSIATLAAGATQACTATYTVTQDDVDGNGNATVVDTGVCASGLALVNLATSTATETDGTPLTETDGTNNDATVCLPGQEPLISVVKSIDVDAAAVDDVIDYAITVTNAGNVTLSDVTLTDVLTDGDAGDITAGLSAITLVSGDNGNGLLDVGEIWVYDATYTVTQDAFDTGSVTNTVSVAAKDPGDADVTDGPSVVTTTFAQEPAIALVKEGALNDDDGIAGVSAGDTISYTFVVTNTGNVTLSNITLDDPLVTVSGSLASLAPGASNATAFTATYTVTQADIDTGQVPNTATVTGTPPAGADVTDDDSVIVPLAQSPAVALVKSGVFDAGDDGVAQPGEIITYTFTATNTGNVTLTDVVVTDPLDGLSAITPDSVSLAVGASAEFTATYAVTQADIDAGEVPNTATVTTAQDVTDEADALVDLPQGPAIALEKRAVAVADFDNPDASGFNDENGDGFAQVGETISYSFKATNTGNVTLTNITLTDPLIDDQGGTISYVSGDTGGDDAMSVGEVWVFAGTYVLTQADIEAEEILNEALVTGTGPKDGTVQAVDDDASAVIDLPANPDFEIVNEVFFDTGGDQDDWVETPEIDSTFNEITGEVVGLEITDPDTGEVLATIIDPTDEEDNTVVGSGQLTFRIVIPNTGNVGLANPNLSLTVSQSGTTLPLASGPTLQGVGGPLTTTDTETDSGEPITISVAQTGDVNGNGILDVGEVWVYLATVDVTPEMGVDGLGGISSVAEFSAERVAPKTAVLDPKDNPATAPLVINLVSPQSPGKDLDIVKTVLGRDTVRQGDIVTWQIEVTNNIAGVPETLDVIDRLPTGFIYRAGSATVDGATVTPEIDGNRVIFRDVVVPGNDSVILRLNTFVGGRVKPGQYVNYAAFIDDGGGSEDDTASVIVGAEPVFDCGTVIGKVFDDKNQNGYQDAPSLPGGGAPVGLVSNDDIFSTSGYGGKVGKLAPPARPDPVEEPGIPGVRLVTVDGKIITTDEYGRFHVGCADLPRDIGSNFLLKLDTRSLPSGYRLTTENPRVIRLTAGKMTKMNFGATISRLVRIDIADNAFTPGTNDPKPAFVAALGRAVPKFAGEPATVRISYVQKGEDRATINRRTRKVEQILRQYWRQSGKYRLMIEKTVQRPR